MAIPSERSRKENPGDFVGKGIITGKKKRKQKRTSSVMWLAGLTKLQ